MATQTSVYDFYRPVVGGDNATWGGFLNSNADLLETYFVDAFSGGVGGTSLGTLKKDRLPAIINATEINSTASQGLVIERTNNADNSGVEYQASSGTSVFAGRGGDGIFAVGNSSNLVSSASTLKIDCVNKTVTILGSIVLTDATECARIGANIALAADASVGTYRILARDTNNTAIVAGTVYAGSSLLRCYLNTGSAGNVDVTGAPGGSWQAMGGADAVSGQKSACLFLRVA